ncbi:hypothetical protein LguiB_012836 [Lonicera macranthoides]
MACEAHAERERRKRSLEKSPSSFPALLGPKAVQSFLAKSRIWGFLLLGDSIVTCARTDGPGWCPGPDPSAGGHNNWYQRRWWIHGLVKQYKWLDSVESEELG